MRLLPLRHDLSSRGLPDMLEKSDCSEVTEGPRDSLPEDTYVTLGRVSFGVATDCANSPSIVVWIRSPSGLAETIWLCGESGTCAFDLLGSYSTGAEDGCSPLICLVDC